MRILDKKFMIGPSVDYEIPEYCWIAGGAIRRWFNNEKKSDIDVFAIKEESLMKFAEVNKLGKPIYDKENIVAYMDKDTPIQLIKRYFSTIEDCLNSFDYTICQFAYDGTTIFATEEAIVSTLRKHIGVAKIQTGYEIDSLRRLLKYYDKGYKPCLGTLKDLVSAFRNAPEDLDEQISISPGGGQRLAVRWD